MKTAAINQTIRHLYEGEHIDPGMPLAKSVGFYDPLVIVRSHVSVMRMFRKLNRFFPHSQLKTFAPLNDGGIYRFETSMHYIRRPDAKPTIFNSIMEVEVTDQKISKIVEHWTSPMRLNGDSQNAISQMVRGGLGRLLS